MPQQTQPESTLKKLMGGMVEGVKKIADQGTEAPAELSRELKMLVVSTIKSGNFKAAVLPTSAQKALAVCSRPRVEPKELVKVIEPEPALASALLRLANSPLYAGRTQILTVQRAVMHLGVTTTKDLLFAEVRKAVFPAGAFKELHSTFFRQALATAAACNALGPTLANSGEQRFFYGLFHNIGKSVILTVLHELRKRGDVHEELTDDNVMSLINKIYVSCGVLLARHWKLHPEFQRAIAYHAAPESSGDHDDPIAILTHLAIDLNCTWGIGYDRGATSIFESPYVYHLSIQPGELDSVAHQVSTDFEKLSSGFGV